MNPSIVSGARRAVISKGTNEYFLDATSDSDGSPAAGAALGASSAVSHGTEQLRTDTWTHLAAAYDGSALKLYVNGKQISSVPYRGSITASNSPLQLGGDSNFGRFFSGAIDEARIYNRALTQSEIQTDMSTPIGAALVSITMTPNASSLEIGEAQQFKAIGTYADGRQRDLTGSVTWTSSSNSTVTVNGTGVALGVAEGDATIRASSGAVCGTQSIIIGARGFSITASPSSLSVAQGKQGKSTITTTVKGGFNNAISLSATGVPSGTTVNFSPNPIPAPGAGRSNMTISVGQSTSTGTYPITVTGRAGNYRQTTIVTLTVISASGFTISASPSTVNIVQGHQGNSTITTAINGSFNSAIILSATGMPTGTTVSFSTNPIPPPGAGTSIMTIKVGVSTSIGSYPLTITGNGGGAQHTTTVTLNVTTSGPQVSLSWNPSQDQVIGYNLYRSLASGGPYSKINANLIPNTNYTDLSVQHGITYYYVATAVDPEQQESMYSNEASANVP